MLELTFKDRLPQTTVEHVDVLALTNAAFRKGYRDGYFSLVKHAPNVVGMIYDKLDKPNPKNLGTQARLSFERTNFGKLSKLLRARTIVGLSRKHAFPAPADDCPFA